MKEPKPFIPWKETLYLDKIFIQHIVDAYLMFVKQLNEMNVK